MKWQAHLRAWAEKRHGTEFADDIVLFFEKSFQTPQKLYPKDAWFGIHGGYVSLTIGNMWLAAVASTPRCAYLLVEESFRIKGMGYIPVRSTARYAPLDLLTAKPWDLIAALNKNKSAWDSYKHACELILKSPISRNVITRNLHRKARLSELL
jgi:hypothetical protein